MHTVGVCGVVFDSSGQVLLVRTAKAGWELPGGRVEAGEDLVTALHREVREETGYALESVSALEAISCHTDRDTVLLVFRASISTAHRGDTHDEDVLEAKWFQPSEALHRVTHPSEHDRLLDALAGSAEVAYRVYRDT
jgi:8-oxo-dGTP diphosphatase